MGGGLLCGVLETVSGWVATILPAANTGHPGRSCG